MPYFCRSVISQAMNHGLQRSLSGSRILLLGVAYKADIGDTRETPAEKLVELLRTAGADVAYHDPHVPEFDGMTSRAARARGLRLRRDRDRALGDRLRRRRPAREGRRRLPQRDERARGRGQGLEALAPGPHRPGRARRVGQEPRPQPRRPRRPRAGSATPTEDAARRVRAALPGRARDRLASTRCSPTPTLEAVVIATPVPTHYALAKQALEAGKHVFVEKPPAMRGAEMAELVDARRGARARAHAGPPAALPPGRAEAEGARRLAATSATCSASTATARTSARSARTRTRSGRSASTTCR